MSAADFVPLQARRLGAAAADDIASSSDNVAQPEIAVAPPQIATAPVEAERAIAQVEPFVESSEEPPEPNRCEDDEERLAALREEAIRFASIATARALRTALAVNESALTQYVDDALRACGRFTRATVRLHPCDVAHYRPRSDVEIIADAAAAQGDVAVETESGSVKASIEQRALLLARASAHE